MAKDLLINLRNEKCKINDSQTIEGVRRLGQQFLIELLTVKGSMYYCPDRGCNFLPRIKAAKTEFDVVIAFAAVKYQIRRNLNVENLGLPNSERFANARLQRVTLEKDTVSIEFIVQSRANTSVKVVTPAIKLEADYAGSKEPITTSCSA